MFAAAAPPPLGSKAATFTAVLSISGNALDLQSGQITFPATQSASAGANTLDDYEEGTWTPGLTTATVGNLSVAYTTQSGTYTKVGRFVYLLYQIVTSTYTWTTASGNSQMTGAPFTAFATLSAENSLSSWGGITKASYTQIGLRITASATTMEFLCAGSAQARSNLAAADLPTATVKTICGALGYFV